MDQLINPAPETYRMAGIFGPVRVREEVGEMYLVFGERIVEPRFVVYCYDQDKEKLVWKTVDAISP